MVVAEIKQSIVVIYGLRGDDLVGKFKNFSIYFLLNGHNCKNTLLIFLLPVNASS